MHWFTCPECSTKGRLIKCPNPHCRGIDDHPNRILYCPEHKGHVLDTLTTRVRKEAAE